jgi:hypothetical protein
MFSDNTGLLRSAQSSLSEEGVPSTSSSTATIQPHIVSAALNSTHIAQLQSQRATLASQLDAVDKELRQALGKQEREDSSFLMKGPEAKTQMNEVLDNFGYIRQFSGEPYDYNKAMGVRYLIYILMHGGKIPHLYLDAWG